MPTTPEPPSVRARTPPTPMHGPQYDNYRPYSPRRSTRSTAQTNPYSSRKTDRSPNASAARNATPPPTSKKARFVRQPTQLSSPPTSPSSPIRQHVIGKTPRKTPVSRQKVRYQTNGEASDSDQPSTSLAPPPVDPTTTLPTPSKTPKKRKAAAVKGTARILSFQPDNPNDLMPSSRKFKKHGRINSMSGFDLYDEERESDRDQVEVYTDANARVPEMDEAEDNPFIGRKVPATRTRRSARATEDERAMEEARMRDEGVVYIFRGKKIFRRFSDPEQDRSSSAGASDVSDVPGQRTLRRQAGTAAQRPLTRSSIKPRLLFPSEEQRLEREAGPDDVDEEATTDIELPNVPTPQKQKGKAHHQKHIETPRKGRFDPVSPPSTKQTKRAANRSAVSGRCTPILEGEESEAEPMSLPSGTFPTHTAGAGSNKKIFDSWKRTKAGPSRKRAGEPMVEDESNVKRARSGAASGSPV
ncbi:hypothetical protein D0868_07890 [Hortaea werneckii]|uniref:Uncharacterized protein n=1 Tax=Hortaea werneckii TaxID=91943 RepID=A0A3M6YID3_HORWE|nr:hypothetical protein D0868_07890 [Hortaea werneckii]